MLKYGPASDFSAIAVRANQDLRARSAAAQYFSAAALVPVITPKSLGHSDKAMRMAEERGPGNLCLSDIGRYDFPGSDR